MDDLFFGNKNIHEKAYIRKEAAVIGDVIIEKDVARTSQQIHPRW